MNSAPDGNIRTMEETDLEVTLRWRNNPSVRRYMFSQHEIQPQEHWQWFKNVQADPNRYLLIFEVGNVASGFVQFGKLRGFGIAEWGFYTDPDAAKGMGTQLANISLDYAFNIIHLHKVFAEVIGFNQGSIKLHKKLGFIEESVLRDHYYDGKNYHDVLGFGLLKNEWANNLK